MSTQVMSFNRHIVRPLTTEERIDRRRRLPGLKGYAERLLPERMVLLTDTPVQAAFKGLVRRIITIGYLGDNARLYTHHAEYLNDVPDELQLCWARDDFQRELAARVLPQGQVN